MIAKRQQRHLEFKLWAQRRRREHHVIGGAILEPADRHQAKILADVTEPEARGIEQVRAEIGQYTGALIAPQDRIYVLATRAGLSSVLARSQPAPA